MPGPAREAAAERAPAKQASAPIVVPAEPVEPKESAWRAIPLEGAFELAYRDAAGNSSKRLLSAVELKVGPGKLLLGGIDGQLDAYRGFRVDRILSLRATDSGEVVSRNILDWLMKRAEKQERSRARGQAFGQPAEARAG